MTYYFSILIQRKASCAKPAIEVRRCVAVEAECVHAAELFVCLQYDYLWMDGGKFTLVQISKLHYETICADLEIEAAK